MNSLKMEKKIMVLHTLLEGNSIRSTERLTGVHRDTIMRLLVRAGEGCQNLMDSRMRGLGCRRIQCDEIWCFVGKKQKRLRATDSKFEMGDQYLYVALDPDTNLIPSFLVGKRTTATTQAFMHDLWSRLTERIQLTTDGYRSYRDAVAYAFGPDVDFAQQIKLYAQDESRRERYSPSDITGTVVVLVSGNPNPAHISTSHVERSNLTIRMQMRRFTRLTNGYSKKLRNLRAAVSLFFAYYNFCRVHSSLRATPAMAAGIVGSVWDLEDLLK